MGMSAGLKEISCHSTQSNITIRFSMVQLLGTQYSYRDGGHLQHVNQSLLTWMMTIDEDNSIAIATKLFHVE